MKYLDLAREQKKVGREFDDDINCILYPDNARLRPWK